MEKEKRTIKIREAVESVLRYGQKVKYLNIDETCNQIALFYDYFCGVEE